MTLLTLLCLYLSFRAKQLVCDFILQTKWMALTKGDRGLEAYKALFVHCGIHALGTLVIFSIFAPALWWFVFVDFTVHSIVDRVKAVLTTNCKWSPKDWKFWWAFGIDQELHNLTHLIYILLIIKHVGLVL